MRLTSPPSCSGAPGAARPVSLRPRVERQVRHHRRARFDDHGAHRRQHLLHRLEEEPRAHHVGRLLVLGGDGAEARGVAGRLGDARVLVAARALDQLDRLGARLRQHLVRVALRLVHGAVAVLHGAEHVVEGGAHRLGRLHVLQLDAEHREARLVEIERLLQRLLGLGLDDAALLGEHVVDRVATDHAAHGRLRRVAQHRPRVGDPVARPGRRP